MTARLLALAIAVALSAPAQAERLITTLSTSRVLIYSNFTGADVVLFGSVERDAQTVARRGGYDIVVTVTGPRENILTFRKERVFGIWVNADSRTFVKAPSYLTVLSNRTITDIADINTLAADADRARPHPAAAGDFRRHRRLDPRRSVPPGVPAAEDRAQPLSRDPERRDVPDACALPRRDPDPRQCADRLLRGRRQAVRRRRAARAHADRARSGQGRVRAGSSRTRRATTACSMGSRPR